MLITAFVLSLLVLGLCIKNFVDSIRMYNEFKVFNENIKDWAESLDEEMLFAINQAAMKLLRDMDDKIEAQKKEEESSETESSEVLEEEDKIRIKID